MDTDKRRTKTDWRIVASCGRMVALAPRWLRRRNFLRRKLRVYALQGDWEGLSFLICIEEINVRELRVRQITRAEMEGSMADEPVVKAENTFGVPGLAGMTGGKLDDLILRTGQYIDSLSFRLDTQKATGQIRAAQLTQIYINCTLRRIVAMDKARDTLPA